jgi:Sigma-70 region 3
MLPSSTSPAVQHILDVLLLETTGAEVVSLDRVAEAIGAAAVTMQEIEAILDALDAAGRRVEAEVKDPPAALARVLKAVRSFSAVSGRRPTLPEIAQHSGLSVGEVRFALLYARVLVR